MSITSSSQQPIATFEYKCTTPNLYAAEKGLKAINSLAIHNAIVSAQQLLGKKPVQNSQHQYFTLEDSHLQPNPDQPTVDFPVIEVRRELCCKDGLYRTCSEAVKASIPILKCIVCDLETKDSDPYFTRHIKTHYSPFECGYCHKLYTRCDSLSDHFSKYCRAIQHNPASSDYKKLDSREFAEIKIFTLKSDSAEKSNHFDAQLSHLHKRPKSSED